MLRNYYIRLFDKFWILWDTDVKQEDIIVNISKEVNVMNCGSCEFYDISGYCNIRQIPVMSCNSAEDCPYYRG